MCAVGVPEEDAGKIGHNCASVHRKPPRGAAKRCEKTWSIQFCDPCDSHIDMGDFIPGGKVGDTGLRKTEDILEFPHCSSCLLAVDAVRLDAGDCCIYLGNGI